MVFRRRYGRYRATRKNKYNIDSLANYSPANASQTSDLGKDYWETTASGMYFWTNIVAPSSVPGTRKIKNIRLSLNLNNDLRQVYYAIVYCPEGTIPSVPGTTSEGYQPSQYVLLQGLVTSLQPVHSSTRLARNLNAGDRIALVCWTNPDLNNHLPVAGEIGDITIYEQHAICYN